MAGYRYPSSCVLRVQHELQNMERDPVPFIYVSADESDITSIKALIIGPLDTPYAGGLFTFDIYIKPAYPMEPPRVVFRTTDGDRVRFNPNLYSNGKVCLSVLGTWTGPAWTSAESISSVLLSIQSLLCPKPYHNEPGYENRRNEKEIKAYSDYIQYETIRVAVIEAVKHPLYEKEFGAVVKKHFLMWYETYWKACEDLKSRVDGQRYRDTFSGRNGKYYMTKLMKDLEQVKARVLDEFLQMSKVGRVPGSNEGASTPFQPPLTANSSPLPSDGDAVNQDHYVKERLLDEFELCQLKLTGGIDCSPRDKLNPFVWDVTVFGRESTPMEGGVYSLEVHFSQHHPSVCPFVRFTSKMFHPNITSDGVPALDLLISRWSYDTKVHQMLSAVQNLLYSPTSIYPVNQEASHLYIHDRPAYDKRVRRLAQDF